MESNQQIQYEKAPDIKIVISISCGKLSFNINYTTNDSWLKNTYWNYYSFNILCVDKESSQPNFIGYDQNNALVEKSQKFMVYDQNNALVEKSIIDIATDLIKNLIESESYDGPKYDLPEIKSAVQNNGIFVRDGKLELLCIKDVDINNILFSNEIKDRTILTEEGEVEIINNIFNSEYLSKAVPEIFNSSLLQSNLEPIKISNLLEVENNKKISKFTIRYQADADVDYDILPIVSNEQFIKLMLYNITIDMVSIAKNKVKDLSFKQLKQEIVKIVSDPKSYQELYTNIGKKYQKLLLDRQHDKITLNPSPYISYITTENDTFLTFLDKERSQKAKKSVFGNKDIYAELNEEEKFKILNNNDILKASKVLDANIILHSGKFNNCTLKTHYAGNIYYKQASICHIKPEFEYGPGVLGYIENKTNDIQKYHERCNFLFNALHMASRKIHENANDLDISQVWSFSNSENFNCAPQDFIACCTEYDLWCAERTEQDIWRNTFK